MVGMIEGEEGPPPVRVATRIRARRTRAGLGSALLVAGALAGCAGEPPPAPYTVRDSAGVEVVEHSWGAMWSADGAWTVDAEPVLSLGTLEGRDETQFFRVATARLRSDGSLLVADAGNYRISAFAPDGTLLWTQGREGGGPDEYQGISELLVLPGDSALIYDFRSRRVTVLGPGGEPARSYTPVAPEGFPRNAPLALVTGGRVVSSAGVVFSTEDEGTAGRLERRPERFLLSDTEGAVADTLGSLPGREMWMVANEAFVSVRSVPFAKSAVAAGGAGRIVLAVTDHPEWRVLDADGELTRIVRLDVEPPEVTVADWERTRDASIPEDAEPETRTRILLDFEEIPPPDRWPAFADLLLDDRGHLWVRQYPAPWEEDAPVNWWVFDPEGLLLGEVTTPAGLEVEQVRGDRVVGIREDELGVQRVEVYRIAGRGS